MSGGSVRVPDVFRNAGDVQLVVKFGSETFGNHEFAAPLADL